MVHRMASDGIMTPLRVIGVGYRCGMGMLRGVEMRNEDLGLYQLYIYISYDIHTLESRY